MKTMSSLSIHVVLLMMTTLPFPSTHYHDYRVLLVFVFSFMHGRGAFIYIMCRQYTTHKGKLQSTVTAHLNAFKPEFTKCYPLQAANCCRYSRFVAAGNDLKWEANKENM